MMNSRFYLLAAALVTLAACGNDNEMTDNATNNGELVPLQVTGSINAAKTRVTNDSQWEMNDQIGINATSGKVTERFKNYKIVRETSNFEPVSTFDAIYYGAETGEFSAYYPYVAYAYLEDDQILGDIITQKTKQTRGTNRIDFMYATANGTKQNPAVHFAFDHKMSKLVIRLKKGKGFGAYPKLSSYYDLIFSSDVATLHSKVKFHTQDGTVTPTDEVGKLEFLYNDGTRTNSGEDKTIDGVEYAVYTYIICPGEVIPNGLNFTLRNTSEGDGRIYHAVLFTDKDKTEMRTEAGKEYVYTVTVNKKEMEVTNATINPWDTVELPNGGEVDAEM